MAEVATDEFERDLALSRLSFDQNAIYEIEEAMTRIRNGSYGVCEITGEPIDEERLLAIPWTRFSLGAQEQLEREGAVSRARLADRASMPTSESDNDAEGGSGQDEI
jgi:RNA polymerase-binding transcription factor DksA